MKKTTKAFNQLVAEEEKSISRQNTHKLIESYLMAEREPFGEMKLDLIEGENPSVLLRKKLGEASRNNVKKSRSTSIKPSKETFKLEKDILLKQPSRGDGFRIMFVNLD
jgi:hypothetical protein